MTVTSPKTGLARGWCHDIGEGGMCGNVSSVFRIADQMSVEIQLPSCSSSLRAKVVVRHARGCRYGFEFVDLEPAVRARIASFGCSRRTTAYILSPNSAIVWVLQKNLQQLGVSQVCVGCPKDLPSAPHIIVVDSDWPDFVEVVSFLRSESMAQDSPVSIIAVVAPTVSAGDAHHAGADLVLHKPLAIERTRKLIDLAYRLVTHSAVETEQKPVAAGAHTSHLAYTSHVMKSLGKK